jgi:hypothetical protein
MSVLTGRRGQISIMVFVTCAVLLLSFISPASAVAGTWRLLTPSEAAATTHPESSLNGVFMINGGTSGKNTGKGWAVGNHSLIFFWDGFSWNQYAATALDCQLNSVNFGGPLNPLSSIRDTSGWAVGGSGHGVTCGNNYNNAVALYWNGAGWQNQTVQKTLPVFVSANMTSVSMVKPFGAVNSADTTVDAFAVGGESDGGLAHGVVWHFSGPPGGAQWQEVKPATFLPAGTQLNGIYMSSCASNPCTTGATGIAVGNYLNPTYPGIYQVTGSTITVLNSPVSVNLHGVAMSSLTNGWAVGDSCTIIRTLDGTTWTGPYGAPCGGTPNLRSIVMTSSSEGWIVGDVVGSGPIVLHGTSLDSASSAQWNKVDATKVTSTVGLNAVTFATSGGNLWAVGAGGVAAFCLNNCSSSSSVWGTTSSPLGGNYVQLNSVAMDSDTDGWAVGQLGPLHTSAPVVMQWNGYSWNTAILSASVLGSTPLLGVALSGGSNGWAVGAQDVTGKPSTVYWNGNSWQTVTSSLCNCNLTSVFMRSGSEAWATGTSLPSGPLTSLWRSTSTGGAFTPQPFNVVDHNITLESITFDPSNTQNGWAVGFIPHSTGGPVPVIVSTTNDGADNWATETKFATQNGYTLNSVSFIDSTHGWAAGSGNPTSGAGTTILNWNGFTWTPSSVILSTATPPINITSIAVDSASPPDGWAVGFDSLGYPVLLAYDGSGWYQTTNLVPTYFPLATRARLTSLFLRSGTNGLAVGSNVLNGPFPNLAVILHLDPPGGGPPPPPPPSTTTSTSTLVTTSTSVVSSSTSSTTSSVVSSTSSSQTVASTSVVTTTVVSTPTTTSTSESTSTSSTSSVSTPMTLPPIPGFPWESIIAGIILGMTALAIVRRRRK